MIFKEKNDLREGNISKNLEKVDNNLVGVSSRGFDGFWLAC
jgi:hypothetical protein